MAADSPDARSLTCSAKAGQSVGMWDRRMRHQEKKLKNTVRSTTGHHTDTEDADKTRLPHLENDAKGATADDFGIKIAYLLRHGGGFRPRTCDDGRDLLPIRGVRDGHAGQRGGINLVCLRPRACAWMVTEASMSEVRSGPSMAWKRRVGARWKVSREPVETDILCWSAKDVVRRRPLAPAASDLAPTIVPAAPSSIVLMTRVRPTIRPRNDGPEQDWLFLCSSCLVFPLVGLLFRGSDRTKPDSTTACP